MSDHEGGHTADGAVHDVARQGDVLAIEDLAISYAHAVDDRDWVRFEALFLPDATIDYRSSGGITGSPSEVAAWMPDAMAIFQWCMHSISTHEIRFTGPDTATGRVHLFNRNGLEWEGEAELLDVGGWYLDEYRRVDDRWRFARRVEKTAYLEGGRFAALVRDLAAGTSAEP
ncbi:MAG: nuclear transport factor 2 family protein [Acidimicrobiales bacterium]